MTFFRGEIFSDFLLHLIATSSNDETIGVTTNVGSRLGDLIVVMELPWKRRGESSGSFFESYGARETKVEADETMLFEGERRREDRQVETEESRKNISISCGSLIENSSRNLAPLHSPFPSSSSSLFSSHRMCTGCVSPSPPCSTPDPSAVPRAVVSFVVNSIFTARDFSVGFLGAVREAVTGILLRLPGFSIIRDKHGSIYLAILDETFFFFFIIVQSRRRRDRKLQNSQRKVPISIFNRNIRAIGLNLANFT